jgi:hypothetical protein
VASGERGPRVAAGMGPLAGQTPAVLVDGGPRAAPAGWQGLDGMTVGQFVGVAGAQLIGPEGAGGQEAGNRLRHGIHPRYHRVIGGIGPEPDRCSPLSHIGTGTVKRVGKFPAAGPDPLRHIPAEDLLPRLSPLSGGKTLARERI